MIALFIGSSEVGLGLSLDWLRALSWSKRRPSRECAVINAARSVRVPYLGQRVFERGQFS